MIIEMNKKNTPRIAKQTSRKTAYAIKAGFNSPHLPRMRIVFILNLYFPEKKTVKRYTLFPQPQISDKENA